MAGRGGSTWFSDVVSAAAQAVEVEVEELRRRRLQEQQLQQQVRAHVWQQEAPRSARNPGQSPQQQPDIALDPVEVAQAAREALVAARRSLFQMLQRHVPEEWQRKIALWILHLKVAVPSLKLIVRRGKQRVETILNVTLPDVSVQSIPPWLAMFVCVLCMRYPRMLLQQMCSLGLGLYIFWEDCDICCETRASISMVSNSCGHRCCRQCLSTYLETNQQERMARMRHARTYNIRCFGGCEERLDRGLALVGSPRMRPFLRQLRRRETFIRRCPEGTQWVECPEMSCVGIGYRGQQLIMCFICEHQWNDPDYGLGRKLWNWMKNQLFPERIDGIEYRCCPHCGAAIVKNGGCDNMRCSMCDGIFRWGVFRNTMQGVVAEHAPPSIRRRHAGAE